MSKNLVANDLSPIKKNEVQINGTVHKLGVEEGKRKVQVQPLKPIYCKIFIIYVFIVYIFLSLSLSFYKGLDTLNQRCSITFG